MSNRDDRIRAALEIRALDGTTSHELEIVDDVDGQPLYIAEAFQQTVVFAPAAFGLSAEEVEAAALIEAAGLTEPKENDL